MQYLKYLGSFCPCLLSERRQYTPISQLFQMGITPTYHFNQTENSVYDLQNNPYEHNVLDIADDTTDQTIRDIIKVIKNKTVLKTVELVIKCNTEKYDVVEKMLIQFLKVNKVLQISFTNVTVKIPHSIFALIKNNIQIQHCTIANKEIYINAVIKNNMHYITVNLNANSDLQSIMNKNNLSLLKYMMFEAKKIQLEVNLNDKLEVWLHNIPSEIFDDLFGNFQFRSYKFEINLSEQVFTILDDCAINGLNILCPSLINFFNLYIIKCDQVQCTFRVTDIVSMPRLLRILPATQVTKAAQVLLQQRISLVECAAMRKSQAYKNFRFDIIKEIVELLEKK